MAQGLQKVSFSREQKQRDAYFCSEHATVGSCQNLAYNCIYKYLVTEELLKSYLVPFWQHWSEYLPADLWPTAEERETEREKLSYEFMKS